MGAISNPGEREVGKDVETTKMWFTETIIRQTGMGGGGGWGVEITVIVKTLTYAKSI